MAGPPGPLFDHMPPEMIMAGPGKRRASALWNKTCRESERSGKTSVGLEVPANAPSRRVEGLNQGQQASHKLGGKRKGPSREDGPQTEVNVVQ